MDRLRPGPVLIASAHQTTWENLFLPILLDNPAMIIEEEVFRYPLVGTISRKNGHIPAHRSGDIDKIRQSVAVAQAAYRGRPERPDLPGWNPYRNRPRSANRRGCCGAVRGARRELRACRAQFRTLLAEGFVAAASGHDYSGDPGADPDRSGQEGVHGHADGSPQRRHGAADASGGPGPLSCRVFLPAHAGSPRRCSPEAMPKAADADRHRWTGPAVRQAA